MSSTSASPRRSGTAPSLGASTVPKVQLDVLEADVVVVLSALCKLAAREVLGVRDDADVYVLSGKHLALELLSKVR